MTENKEKEKKIMPSPEQLKAIETIDKNVAVSAGAGSGKTRVLVSRFTHILEQNANRIDASNILAITFTRKAAGEMKSRLRKSMNELAHGANGAFWRKQLLALERAQITTIDGLCSRILRENPVEAQLDPGFIQAEEFEGTEFVLACLQRFVRIELRKHEETPLHRLVGLYGLSSFIRQVQGLVSKLAEFAEQDLTEPYKKSAAQAGGLRSKLCRLISNLAARRNELTKAGSKGRLQLETVAEHLEEITGGINAEPADFAAYEAYIGVIKGQRGAFQEELVVIRDCRTQIDRSVLDQSALPVVADWQQVLGALHEYIQKQKQEIDFVSFDDLEQRAVQLLAQNAQVREKYHQRFPYIMVDEFQDTNDLQRRLIYLLCGDNADELQGKKLFVVGDPKQSIYRFRGADVSVFARVRQNIADGGGLYLTLGTNYRSKNLVLDVCNEVFRPLLGEDKSKDVFFEALNPHQMDGIVKPKLLEVTYSKEDKALKRDYEADAVAAEMRRLHDEEGVAFGEMAVLLRAMTNCGLLTRHLAAQNIPFVIVNGRGFYECQEVLDILNLLQALNNHHRSLELAGALRSPMFGLDDVTLTRLFLSGAGSLWEAVQLAEPAQFGEQRALLLRAAQILRRLHTAAALLALPELWQQLRTELALDAVLARQGDDLGKLENVKKLHKLALEYCAANANKASLGEWLEYVGRLRAADTKETAATLETVDAVEVMTIHKSKGLEFDTVFLPMLDSGNDADTSEIMYLPKVGLGIKAMDAEGALQATGVLQAAKKLDKELNMAERMRQLYVAMTRAKVRLVMSGATAIDASADKNSLQERSWLKQLQEILGEKTVVERKQVTGALSEPLEKGEQLQLTVTPELQTAIAPLPAYANNGRSCFTASALQTYLHCPRQYYYQQVLALPALEQQDEAGAAEQAAVLPAYVTGLVVHRALELYHRDASEESLSKESVKQDQAAFDKALKEQNLEQAPLAQRLFFDYIASDLYNALPTKGQQRELHFLLPTEKGFMVDGVIDYLAQAADGSLVLVDYKTGAAPAHGEVKLGYAYQLALYKRAAEAILQRKVTKAQLHFLQDLSVWELPEAPDYYEAALDLCAQLAAKKEEAEFVCQVSTGCSYCPYAYLCKQK